MDAFGSLGDAVADAASRAKLGKPDAWQTRYIEDSTTPLSQLLGGMLQSRAGIACCSTVAVPSCCWPATCRSNRYSASCRTHWPNPATNASRRWRIASAHRSKGLIEAVTRYCIAASTCLACSAACVCAVSAAVCAHPCRYWRWW